MSKRAKVFVGDPNVACVIGLSEAVVFAKIKYWSKKSGKAADGKTGWFYKTFQEFHDEDFPFLSDRHIKRIVKKLIKLGLVESGEFNAWRADRTRWYRVADDFDEKLKSIVTKCHNAKCQNVTMPLGQNVPSNNHEVHNQKVLTNNSDIQSVADAQKNLDFSNPQEKVSPDEVCSEDGPTNKRLLKLNTVITQLLAKNHLDSLPFELNSPVPKEHRQHAYQLCLDFARATSGFREDYELDEGFDNLLKYDGQEKPDYEAINRGLLKKMLDEFTVEDILECVDGVSQNGREFGFNFKDVRDWITDFYDEEDLPDQPTRPTEEQPEFNLFD